ncbi:MAG: spore germination protein [Vulcanibacillus sp.]
MTLLELEGKKISRKIEDNVKVMNQILGIDHNFDVIYRKLNYGDKEFALYFVDGFAKDDIMNYIMVYLGRITREELVPNTLTKLLERHIGYLEVDTSSDFKHIVTQVLSGPLALFIDGEKEAILIDARTYPARGPAEPDLERVVRGSRDGFVETLIFNTALTRRRLRDPSLRMEYMQVGERSKTDIAIAYLEDIANPDLINLIKDKLEKIDVDGLSMAEKTLEEYLFTNHWNPYPMVRYTERPDVASVHLLEGHVLIYVDTSPSVMITPTTFFHHVQHAEEYRQKPIIGAYLRWIRFIAIITSIILLPLWLLVANEPSLLSEFLSFIGPNKEGAIPLFWQFIMAEIGLDILRMAAVHTPSSLTTALGLIAAIIIGQMAIDVGLFTKEVILYLAVATIGSYATPSYELGLANRIIRLFLLTMVSLFGLWGLVIGVLSWLLLLGFSKSFDTPYLWPLVPFNGSALLEILVRSPVPYKNKRQTILSPKDPDKSAGK